MFFVLACAWSWPGFFLHGLGRAGVLGFAIPAEVPLLAEYGPTFAALLLCALEGGWPAVKQLLASGVRWRVRWYWYLVVLFGDAALLAALIGFRRLLGHPVPDLAQLGGWTTRFVDHMNGLGPSLGPVGALVSAMQGHTAATVLGAAFVAIISGGVTEEFGWRGYAQPGLSQRWSALRASVVVGAMWALWHLGPWFLFFTAPAPEAALTNATFVLEYLAGCIPLAVLMGWVYYNTRGSVLLMILAHAAHNTVVSIAFRSWEEFPYYWWLGAMWVAAAVVTILFGPARLVRGGRSIGDQNIQAAPSPAVIP